MIIDPHAYVDPWVDIRNLSSEHPTGYAFLNGKELSLFRQLIEDQRSLPVHRAGCWVCYECSFESADLTATARHIVRAHRSTP
jgi:hypothetical protein